MKQYFFIVISFLFSVVLAILAYRYIDFFKEVIIWEIVVVCYINFDQMDVSKQCLFFFVLFIDFLSVVEVVILVVVNIKMIQGGGGFDFWGSVFVGFVFGFGVIIFDDGYIVINNYVIEDSDEIEVIFNDKCEYCVELIGMDFFIDLVLIKVNVKDFFLFEFGNLDFLRVGEWVLAIGNFFNFEFIVIFGIVSVKGCSIDILEGQDWIEFFI